MKHNVRILALIAALALLMAGCALKKLPEVQEEPLPETSTEITDTPETESELPEAEQNAETETESEQSDEPAEPAFTLLDNASPIGTLGNAWEISADAISHMYAPEVRLFGNALLFSQLVSNEETTGLEIIMISLEDGRVLAETYMEGSDMMRLQIGEAYICVHDSAMGKAVFLNDTLSVESEITLEQDCEQWFFDRSFETLYVFAYFDGVRAVSLTDGSSIQLVKGKDVQVLGNTEQYVVFSYRTERGDCFDMSLELDGGTLMEMPRILNAGQAFRSRESWFIRDGEEWGKYHILREDDAWSVTYQDGLLMNIPLREKLVATAAEATELAIYEMDGTFLTKFNFAEETNFYPDYEFVWSGYWQGWFFTANRDDKTILIFWDPSVQTEGTALKLEPMSEAVVPGGVTAAADLYDRAYELSQRFGMDIRIADQCSLDYTNRTAFEVTNTEFITLTLDIIERCFSLYPEGFFRQLSLAGANEIIIEVVGGIGAKPGDNSASTTAAFVSNRGGKALMVLDCYLINDYTLHHEVSHLIDRKLAYDSSLRSDALFSEEVWLSLQPEGFTYFESYTEDYEAGSEFYDSSYFAARYGTTYPTEDRATLFGTLMIEGFNHGYFPEPMRAKLAYYTECIRDGFDTEGWPEQTYWEYLMAG